MKINPKAVIIFPHIPKTAGFGIKSQIENDTSKRILLDYGDAPLSKYCDSVFLRKISKEKVISNKYHIASSYDVIYGHFMADKYASYMDMPDTHLICFLRDPVERTISHYCYWKKAIEMNSYEALQFTIMPILSFLRDGMSLLEFSSSEEMRNVYKIFLGTMEPKDFSFIGITERFDESISIINERFGTSLMPIKNNVTDRSKYQNEIEVCYDEIKSLNKENYEYYNEAIKIWWK